MTELSSEILIAFSVKAAIEVPENRAVVEALVTKMDDLFRAEKAPQWAVVVALTMMMEIVRQSASNDVVSAMSALDKEKTSGTN